MITIRFVSSTELPDTSLQDRANASVPSSSWELHQLWARLRENSLLSLGDRDIAFYGEALEIIEKYHEPKKPPRGKPVNFPINFPWSKIGAKSRRKPRGGRAWWDKLSDKEKIEFGKRTGLSRRGLSTKVPRKRSRTAKLNWKKKTPEEREAIREKMRASQRARRERERAEKARTPEIDYNQIFEWA